MNFKLTHVHLLFKRLLIVFAAFTLCRLVFFSFNAHQFGDAGFTNILQSFFAGLVFDTAAAVYTFGLFILLHIIPFNFRNSRGYQLFLKYYFVIVLFACVLFNMIDVGYFPFSGRRSGVELFSMKGEIADLAGTYLLTYWYLAVLLPLMVYLAARIYPKLSVLQKISNVKQFVYELFVMGAIVAACFVGARGGWWNLKPLSAFDAARFADARLVHLTLNTPFQLIRTSQQAGLTEKNYMPAAEALRLFDPQHKGAAGDHLKGKNVVLIIIESLGKEYVGYHNGGKGFTPFIDSLMKHSLVYTHAYANGKRSIEGIPAIIASMPSVMQHDYISSKYQSNRLKGIGAYMQEAGYDASFYHGGKNGTMGFSNFIAITGSGKYYGMNEYPDIKDFDGNWGIYDEPYLQYFADELSRKPKPFFSAIFTLSSHHPYSIPAHRASLFEEGFLPIHKSIRYADFSLGQFFQKASHMPWFKNTVFVITSDHSAANHEPYYQSQQGRFEIPLFVFDPQQPVGSENAETAQHADILPVIVSGMQGISSFGFGNFEKKKGFAVQFTDDVFQLIRWPYVYQFDGDKGTGFFNLEEDPLMQQNKLGSSGMQPGMDSLVKSFVQQYNGALIHNRTTDK